MRLQAISKRLFPGCVKSGQKVAFCLPSAGRKTQLFHHIFFQPGKSLLEIPCTNIWRYWTTLRQLRFILWTSSNHLFHHWIFRPDFHSVLILLNLSINGKSNLVAKKPLHISELSSADMAVFLLSFQNLST